MAPEDDDQTPLDAATEALRRAAEARGVPYEAPAPKAVSLPDDRDPLAAVEAALAKAAGAREYAQRDPRAAEREDRARRELARLKGMPDPEPATFDDDDSTEELPESDAPPRRRL